ncbi:uncharacterized protein LOC128331390 [Hemicordylus capensis]|uniref:uncharacterized protein LOC128331390 n=1 Tax=Hemicordylus capensis TaxID=884348 RepID=UPI002304CACD|nr:uncharacterized protein LOC128331390 [Hemicordylus capensis]
MAFPVTKDNELPALGRPLHLGMLYDRRSDTLIPGITLWDPEALQKHVRTKLQPKTECHMLASDNYDNLASALNLTLPLKASLLGGNVDLHGSAKYLKDTRKSRNQVRLVLHYSITTRFEELTMSHLGPQNIAYPGVFDQGEATHVVTAVLYGAQAFCIFDREVASSENKEDTEREMRASIQMMLKEANQGDETTSIQKRGKTNMENFRCTFYGDVALESNPITDPDAMRIYSNLPKLLGEKGEKAVPVKVWLYPLAKLDPRAAQLVREISADLITRAQAVIEHLSDCETQCQDLVSGSHVCFPVMREKIQHFQKLCKRYQVAFQEQLARVLPSIRGGGQEEEALREILTRNQQSPFHPKGLTEFLSKKSAEMEYVNLCCTLLPGVRVIPSACKLKQVLFDHQCQRLLAFMFTSLQRVEPYLLALEGWIQEGASAPAAPASSADEKPQPKQWFEEEAIVSRARESLKSFSDFVGLKQPNERMQFIVASVPDGDNPGVSIYAYEEGKLVSRHFQPPLHPFPPGIDWLRHDSLQLLLNPRVDGGSCVEYRVSGQENWASLPTKQGEEKLLVRNLLPNTSYQFRYAVPGLGGSSSESTTVKTLPTGPPGKPQRMTVEASAISVTWKSPQSTGEGVAVQEYKLQYQEGAAGGGRRRQGEKAEWGEVVVPRSSGRCKVAGLRPETPYRFRVCAVSSDGTQSAPSEEAVIATLSPDPPFQAEEASSIRHRALPVKKEKGSPTLGRPLLPNPCNDSLMPGKTPKEATCGPLRTMAGPDDVVELPALGRSFQLGMLYDCRRDALLSEHLLLDPETLQRHTEQRAHTSHTMEPVSAGTIGEKAAALDIQPSLLTSLLCGLFEVSGAAKYLLGPRKSRPQDSSITYKYLAIERVEQLRADCFRAGRFLHPSALNNCVASHVVTAVWYGAQAFLDCHKDASSSENVDENMGSSIATKTKLPSQSKTDLKTDNEEGPQHQNVGDGFGGDFPLKNKPVTFQDAMKRHIVPIRFLGESSETAVPVKVRLYPLKELGLRDCEGSFHEIRDVLNCDIKDEFEALAEIRAQCKDFLDSLAAKTFPETRKKIQHFQDLCGHHKKAFQRELAETVASVRGGVKAEKDLEEVLTCKQQSPFNTQRLHEFLGKQEQEIAVVNSLLLILKDIEAICLKKELHKKLLDPKTDCVVAFMFTSLHKEESYFSELKASLSSSKQPKDMNPETQRETQSSTEWFEDENEVKRAKEAARSFSAFARANLSRKETQFLVASIPDENNPGVSIYLYESGHLKGTTFEPPSKPLPIVIEGGSQDSVQLRLTPAQLGKDAVSSCQVEYRVTGQEKWAAGITEGNGEMLTVKGLRPDTEYQFRYSAISKPGLSESSDVSDSVRTLPAGPSGMPKEAHVGSHGLAEGGKNTCKEEENTHYTDDTGVVRDNGEKQLCEPSTNRERENVGSAHSFPAPTTLTADVAASGSKPSGESENVASSFLSTSRMIRKGSPSVYALPLEKLACNSESTCLKYRFGKKDLQLPHKVIVLLGETGAGKSTLINGMVNYILGVRWEDHFRFSLVQEDPTGSWTSSQADKLTAYEINSAPEFQVPYSLTIIDTPGFGGTRGLERDRMLLEQIWEFFLPQAGVDHLDALCFVAQASQLHLTQPQKYMFDSALSVFGRDIQDNIQVLVTFADGRTPPVLGAIKEGGVPCAQDAHGVPVHSLFNNSALLASNVQTGEDSYHFYRMFWEIGVRSMAKFFQSLNYLEPQSFTWRSNVSEEQKELEAAMQGMEPPIKRALVRLQELKKTCRALERHGEALQSSRDVEYEAEKIVPVMLDISGTGYFSTNCPQCQSTCHYPCQFQGEKWKCIVIDDSGHCRVCPGKCLWETHCSQGHRWDYWVKKERQSYRQLKQQYQEAHGEPLSQEKALEWAHQESRSAEKALEGLVLKSSHYLQRLQRTASNPSCPPTISEYSDLLIRTQKEDQQPGYEERISMLQAMKAKFLSNSSAGRS